MSPNWGPPVLSISTTVQTTKIAFLICVRDDGSAASAVLTTCRFVKCFFRALVD